MQRGWLIWFLKKWTLPTQKDSKDGCCNGCGSISRKDSMTQIPVAGKFCATVPETTAEICLTN